MRGFFCALFAGILCLESIGGFCRQGYVSEGIREQATHLFHETAEKEAGQLQEEFTPVCTGGGASGCRLRAGTIWKK